MRSEDTNDPDVLRKMVENFKRRWNAAELELKESRQALRSARLYIVGEALPTKNQALEIIDKALGVDVPNDVV